MALKNATAPAFESMETSGAQADQPAAGTAVAAPKNTAVSTAVFKPALLDKQDVLKTEDIEAIGFGTFPRVTADLGGLLMGDVELGKTAKVEILSWNLRHVVTPNSNDQEAKKLVKISYDGETISGSGESVKDAIEALKAIGYPNASVKLYGDLWGNLVNSEKMGDIPVEKQQMVQIQMSPQSLQQFKRFQLEQGIKEGRGQPKVSTLTITCERQEFNGNRFGRMTFSA